jgi:choline monooxygenase
LAAPTRFFWINDMAAELEPSLESFWEKGSLRHGLPSHAYTDENFWKDECASVFTENWVCVGFAHELAKTGDIVPITVAGKPLMLVRGRDGQIACFHNTCRHRCMILVDKPVNVGKTITCPYHAWSYGLDGSLRSAPYFNGRNKSQPVDPVLAKERLAPVRLAVWHDWIFVNLDGKAPPFLDYAKPLIDRLEGIDFTKLNPVAMLNFGEVATNWKFIMENFIEPYHVQFVHKTTTDQPLVDHYTIVDPPCLGSAVDLDRVSDKAGSLAVSSRYLTLFPNFILGRYFPDQLGVYLNVPLGPDRTVQKRVIYATEGQTYSEGQTDALKKLWWDVHKEDHAICERMQQGRASPEATSGGYLSPVWEDSVRGFQELVASAVSGKSDREGLKA